MPSAIASSLNVISPPLTPVVYAFNGKTSSALEVAVLNTVQPLPVPYKPAPELLIPFASISIAKGAKSNESPAVVIACSTLAAPPVLGANIGPVEPPFTDVLKPGPLSAGTCLPKPAKPPKNMSLQTAILLPASVVTLINRVGVWSPTVKSAGVVASAKL